MFSSPAYAQTAGAATAAGGGFAALYQFTPFVMMAVIFYFLLIRPQQQRAKALRAMIEGIKKGDVVITAGGLIGRVLRVDGDEVELELAPTVKVRAIRATLTEVRGTGKPAND